MKVIYFWAIQLVAATTWCSASFAAGENVGQLKAEIDRLKEQSVKQTKIITILVKRLQRMEKIVQSNLVKKSSSKKKTLPKNKTKDKVASPADVAQAKKGAPTQPSPQTPSSTPSKKSGVSPPTAKVAGAAVQPGGVDKKGAIKRKEPADAEATRPESVSKPRMKESMKDVLTDGRSLIQDKLIVETGFRYSHTSRQQVSLSGFLALDTIFIGEISVDEVESDILQFNITPRYGFSDRLEVDLDLPFLYRNTTFRNTGTGAEDSGPSETEQTMNFEFGDISAGLYYKLVKEHDWVPDIVWNIRAKAPTGSDPFGIKTKSVGDIQLPERFPSGNGVWALSTGLSFVKTADPTILFASLAYFHNLEESFDDISTDPNKVVPGRVDLGDSFQLGLGFALAFNERMSFSLSYSQLFTGSTKIKPEGGSWSKSIGSDANSASLNFGLTYALNDNLSVVANVGAGLTPDAPDMEVGIKFPYTF